MFSQLLKVHYATFFYRPVNKQTARALDARNSMDMETTVNNRGGFAKCSPAGL